jgi:ERF superfamily
MNIYAKLQTARKNLNDANLGKSGKNAFGNGFKYFELKDFMPAINDIFTELNLIGITDFSGETIATLSIFDTEKDDCSPIVFSCPKAESGLRQGTPIQNVGAQQTYIRRYLWVQALEITEDDSIDSLGDDQKITQADANRQKAVPKDIQEAKAHKEKLQSSASIEELAKNWAAIPPKFKTQDLIVTKDKLKEQLTPIDQKITDCTTREGLSAICEGLTPQQQSEYDQLIADKFDEFLLNESQR